jgi:hypothetical protein
VVWLLPTCTLDPSHPREHNDCRLLDSILAQYQLPSHTAGSTRTSILLSNSQPFCINLIRLHFTYHPQNQSTFLLSLRHLNASFTFFSHKTSFYHQNDHNSSANCSVTWRETECVHNVSQRSMDLSADRLNQQVTD